VRQLTDPVARLKGMDKIGKNLRARDDVPPHVVEKILRENARHLYGVE
jgi:hypothetical protein